MLRNLKKVWRFICIYGVTKTLYKVAGRSRKIKVHGLVRKAKIRDIGILGCGQFGFATIGHVIGRSLGNRFIRCYDTDSKNSETFAQFYKVQIAQTATDLIGDKRVQYIYIASNHASHAEYALQCINSGKTVYIEKPISVSTNQFKNLVSAIKEKSPEVYAGYNRPFSGAIRELKKYCQKAEGPITLNCFIAGHLIPPGHWYRNPEEGTRVCGNIGHWIDLAVHILSWNILPDRWEITIAYSDLTSRDDNLSITLISDRGDLINILLTARCEPFEGINETINFQGGNVIAKIDDFRKMSVWRNEEKYVHRYWPKDVGHQKAILQPFIKEKRNWREVELSTLLMLFIMEMVKNGQRYGKLSLLEEWEKIALPLADLGPKTCTTGQPYEAADICSLRATTII